MVLLAFDKKEDQATLTFFMNLTTISNRLVNSKGEIIVSEYVKIADHMEAAGMGEIAKFIFFSKNAPFSPQKRVFNYREF